jgi:predicted RNase H-like nuclease (RuvC/YqgF family)
MSFSDPRGFTFGSQVTVNGPVFAQAFIQTSSRRFKNDVKPIEQPLEKISKLQGVRFTWDEEKGGRDDLGFIAEDVAEVIPEVVSWEDDGQNARGVNYDHLVAVAIEGIKAQQSQIQTLEREKAELKESLASMQAKLDRLSATLETLMAR